MLKLEAKLLHMFTSADYHNKETGEVVKGKTKLQLLTQVSLRNGEIKNELLDISIPADKTHLFKDKENETVTVDVALIGKAQFYGI